MNIAALIRSMAEAGAPPEATAAVAQAYPRRSLPWLGRQLHRDHSTIHFALRKAGMRT